MPNILERLQAIADMDGDLAVQARARMALQQLSKLSKSILFAQADGPTPPTVKTDWQLTLDKLYRRKSDERRPTMAEGDPQQFRAAASQIQAQRETNPPHVTNPKKKNRRKGLTRHRRWGFASRLIPIFRI